MRRIGAILLTLGVTAALCVLPAAPSSAALPPDGRFTVLPDTIPNYFIAHPSRGDSTPTANSDVRIMADPQHDLFFEFDGQQCTKAFLDVNAVVYDLTNYRVKAKGCVDRLQPGTKAASGAILHYEPRAAAAQGGGVTGAVDPTRAVFFLTADADTSGCKDGQHDGLGPCVVPPQVAVFDETLRLHDVWDLPVGAPPEVSGLSLWTSPDGKHRQVVVVADWGGESVARVDDAVHVYAFDVDASLGRGAAAKPVWDTAVTSCTGPISTEFASVSAYRSRTLPAVFVPCEIGSAGPQTGHQGSFGPAARDGVVSIAMTPCASGLCPGGVGSEHAVGAPGFFSGFVFDPGSDRGFGLSNGLDAGVTALAYDGRTGEFVGRTAVGDKSDANGTSVGIDPRTGRLYGTGAHAVTLVDGRRTPVAPGIRLPISAVTQRIDVVAVPPRPDHQYTRVFLPAMDCSDESCALFGIRIAADRVPVTTNPPFDSVDANTYDGPLAGRDVATTYAGGAGGFGMRATWVGSANALLADATNRHDDVDHLGIPLGEGTRSLVSGYVVDTSLTTSDASAHATPLAADDGTRSFYENSGPPPSPAPRPPRNTWPYDVATCSDPGGDPHGSVTPTAGAATTTCAGSSRRQASADASFGGVVQGVPQISVGGSRTTTAVTAPAGPDGVTTEITASVTGVRITIDASDEIRIGEVVQHVTATATGRRGGARTARDGSTVRGLSVTVNGSTKVLCPDACGTASDAARAISEAFPEFLRAIPGIADADLAHGSPGGYRAGIQSAASWIDADHQFNAMSVEEAAFLPSLRIVLYNDGDALSRVVVDLAGVKANAQQGVQALASFDGGALPAPSTRTTVEGGTAAPSPLGGFRGPGRTTPGPTVYVPSPSGIAGLLVRAFHGFSLLARHPAELASVAALLALLVAPALLMARRRTWLREAVTD